MAFCVLILLSALVFWVPCVSKLSFTALLSTCQRAVYSSSQLFILLFKHNEECSWLSSTHTLAWDVFLWHRIEMVLPQVKDNFFLRLGIRQVKLVTDASALLYEGFWQEVFWRSLITSFQISSLCSTLSQNYMSCAIVSHSFIDSSEAGCQHCASSVNAGRTISWKGRHACFGAIQSSKQDECCKRGNRNRNDKNLQVFGEPEG